MDKYKNHHDEKKLQKYIFVGIALLCAWVVLYNSLHLISHWLTITLLSPFSLSKESGSGLASSLEFFLFDTPKVLMLLILVVFFVNIIQSFFTPEKTRKILSGKKEFVGNILAALLGIVTPFCSCSAIPLFIGFVTAGIPLGVTFSFLIAAPMVNEVALILLYGIFGVKVALLYLTAGLLIAIISGWIIGRLGMEGFVEPWVYATKSDNKNYNDSSSNNENNINIVTVDWVQRIQNAIQGVFDIVGSVWPYVVAGIAIGAFIHGYVPEHFMASIMGKDVWWAVPLSVIIGIPLYSNAAGIIPIVSSLLAKGAALGTVLAFMMSVIGLSLPEAIILRKVLKPPLLVTFFSIVGFGILLVGYLFNMFEF